MHLLAIDPSTKMGWALLIDDKSKPEKERLFYGTWDLTKWDDGEKRSGRGAYYTNFLEQFRKLRRLHGIDDDEIKIVLEGEAYAASRTEDSARLASGWLAVLEIYCYRKNHIPPLTATPDEWRSAYVQCTRAPKEVGVGLESAKKSKARTEWMKNKVILKCKSRGLYPKDDNQADALGMLYWLMHGGEDTQRMRREDKKEKSLAKRRQKKMNFKVAA